MKCLNYLQSKLNLCCHCLVYDDHGLPTLHHATFHHATVNHGHLITGHLITLKFNHGDTYHALKCLKKSHNAKTSKIY